MREVKKNPHLSAPKLTKMVEEQLNIHVNPETVRRVLRKHGYNGRTARNKPFISSKNRKKRLEFALKYVYKDMSFWQKVHNGIMQRRGYNNIFVGSLYRRK